MFDGLRRLSGARFAQLPATYGPRPPRAARSWSSASHAGGCSVDGGTRRRQRLWRKWRRRHYGACVGGIGSTCGAGGVCNCGGGGASCVARGVCVGVARGPGRFSSTISAMVVESKPDVELPTAPFWFRYVNFEPLLVWRQPLQPPAVYGPRPPRAVRSRSSPLVQLRAARRPSALS